MKNNNIILDMLADLYGGKSKSTYAKIEDLVEKYDEIKSEDYSWVDENDVMVITYADTIISKDASGVKNLNELFEKYITGGMTVLAGTERLHKKSPTVRRVNCGAKGSMGF